jgi:hypothetical protein
MDAVVDRVGPFGGRGSDPALLDVLALRFPGQNGAIGESPWNP